MSNISNNKTKIVLATGNKNKIIELNRMLQLFNTEIVSPSDMGVSMEGIEETGTTFAENAYIKAKAISKLTNLPAIADDSGLCIVAKPHLLGVYSSRFCGEDASYDIKIARIIEEMKNLDKENRSAYFECAICMFDPNKKEQLHVSGKCYGEIGYEPKGENGFGYDPIFYIDGKSFAELNDDEKDKLSHRGKAMSEFVNIYGNDVFKKYDFIEYGCSDCIRSK